ncbi:MAG: outer membrane protein assembly factor BamE [Candidatus Pacebacteria bacterium]|nr:outer membrane protein assembly factor BamE [Candidatus Paceibacterota bacterium]
MNRCSGLTVMALVVASLGLTACSAKIDERGILLDAEALATVKPGQTRTEVVKNIGNPSTIATFNDQHWYYISRRTKSWLFLPPYTTEQKIVEVVFDKAGIVNRITTTTGFEQTVDISPTSRVTPSKGHTYGLMEDFLGNLGRFNNAKSGR